MSSGLDQLHAQRERSSRRSMPPPRNPPRATPVALPVEHNTTADTDTQHPAAEAPQHEPAVVNAAVDAESAVVVAPPSAAEPAVPSVRPAPSATKASPRRRVKAAPTKSASPPVEPSGAEDELAKYSIYFDGTADEFLEATRVAGRRLKPKLSISRSSVVRLALERLSDSMSPDEVAAELSRNATVAKLGTGRPRL